MVFNYLLIALRNFKLQKGYAFLNSFGLAVGIAACLLISLYVIDETGYDKHHPGYNRIYRVAVDFGTGSGGYRNGFATIAPRHRTYLQSDITGIETSARLFKIGSATIELDDRNFEVKNAWTADPEIFDILSIPVLVGKSDSVLSNSKQVLLSEQLAEKIFGGKNPVGEIIKLDSQFTLQVSGVFRDSPQNSHIHFDVIANMTLLREASQAWYDRFWEADNFSDNYTATYIKLEQSANVEEINKQLPVYLDKRLGGTTADDGSFIQASKGLRLKLQPVSGIHLSSHQMNEFEPGGSMLHVRLFVIIAVFILLIACINYINLSTARAARRAREVGLRKATGAGRGMLIAQFLSESILTSFIATVFAIGIAYAFLPAMNNLTGKELSLYTPAASMVWIITAVVFLAVGFLAGLYPAFYLSAFQPSTILRGEVSGGRKGEFFRKILVVFQFTVSVALVVCVTVVIAQMNYIVNRDLGYNRENILLLPMTNPVRSNWNDVRARLENVPGVLNVCKSKRVPSGVLGDNPGFTAIVNGEQIQSKFAMPHIRVSHNFLKTYKLELIAGRDFNPDIASDSTGGYILNESAVRSLGFATPGDAVGTPMQAAGWGNGTVIGVVRDFNYESLRKKIIPVILYPSRESNTISVRIDGSAVQETIAGLSDIWNEIQPGLPLSYEFLDDRIASLYHNEERLMQLFVAFSMLAMLIACLGLVGLATFAAERRTREIGIRKTFGATVPGILRLVIGQFLLLVLTGSAIAIPLAWLGMTGWLNSFAYRTELHPLYFVIAVVITGAIALGSVLTQAFRAASINPVNSLRCQ